MISLRTSTMDADDLSNGDFDSILQDSEKSEEPDETDFEEFSTSDLFNSPLFSGSQGSCNSFELQLQLEDMEPTPMAPSTANVAYQRQQLVQMQQQQQQLQQEQMEQQIKFSLLKPTNQLFEPTPMRSEPKTQTEKEKRMMIDTQGFPVYKEKSSKSNSKKTKQRQKPVHIAPAGPIPIAPMPTMGIPPVSIPLTSHSDHGPMLSRSMMLDTAGNPYSGATQSVAMHPGMHSAPDPFVLLAQHQLQQNMHVAPMSASPGSFTTAYGQETQSQSMQHIPTNNIQMMEKLCESMKRSAMSRTLVNQLSAASGGTAVRLPGRLKKSAAGRMPRPPSFQRSQSNESSDSERTTPRPTRKPSMDSKHRGGARQMRHRGGAVTLPIDFHSGDDLFAPRDNRTVYSADNFSAYSTDNSTAHSSYSGQTI